MMRAQQHLESLDAAIDQWSESRPYRFRKQRDPDTGWYIWTCRVLRPPPVQLGLIFGDYLNNLRSALDYLAQALVKRGGKNPSRRVRFPILLEVDEWDTDRTKVARKGIPARWVAVIESLQPYRRGDAAADQPLAILNKLANLNEHRLIHAVAINIQDFNIVGRTFDDFPGGTLQQIPLPAGSRLEDGTEILRVRIEPPAEFDVDMDDEIAVQIAWDYPHPTVGPFPDLTAEVQGIIELFLPAFE